MLDSVSGSCSVVMSLLFRETSLIRLMPLAKPPFVSLQSVIVSLYFHFTMSLSSQQRNNRLPRPMPVIDLARLLGQDFRQRHASNQRRRHPGEPRQLENQENNVVRNQEEESGGSSVRSNKNKRRLKQEAKRSERDSAHLAAITKNSNDKNSKALSTAIKLSGVLLSSLNRCVPVSMNRSPNK